MNTDYTSRMLHIDENIANFEESDGFEDVPINSNELTDIPSISMEDLDYLRYFIIHSANYVEELESAVCERSDLFWDAREHAYRIVTSMLIDLWEDRQ